MFIQSITKHVTQKLTKKGYFTEKLMTSADISKTITPSLLTRQYFGKTSLVNICFLERYNQLNRFSDIFANQPKVTYFA